MSDNELDIEDIEEMTDTAPHRRTSDDWIVKHWPILLTFVLVIMSFVRTEMITVNNSKTTTDNESDISKMALTINDIDNGRARLSR